LGLKLKLQDKVVELSRAKKSLNAISHCLPYFHTIIIIIIITIIIVIVDVGK
jgi:hypothetical protein